MKTEEQADRSGEGYVKVKTGLHYKTGFEPLKEFA